MGVPGLWDILRPAGRQRSLTDLAVTDGFEANPSGRRGLRIGIDASIWFYHAAYGKEGENPELRTLFFRCARLMGRPFLPLFVFDGPKRPSVKRGKRISGKDHWLTTGMQRIIESFGFEWRTAPGEAEAELAFLNRIGVIDAIISDDVDNFLFGAKMIIRNPSKNLSGNRAHAVKNSAGKEDEEHVYTYHSSDLLKHEDVSLTHGGLILIGLLRGGDYHQEGLPGCGPNIAHGLARCGFGDSLVEAAHNLSREHLSSFLSNWRHEVRQELRTNSRGFLNSKKVKLASALPETFPDIDILLSYTNPIISKSDGKGGKITYSWDREPDLGRIAGICELYFEWGVKEMIVKRFRTVIWGGAVLRILRRSVLEKDADRDAVRPLTPKKNGRTLEQCGTPSSMIAKHFASLQLDPPSLSHDRQEEEKEEEGPLIVKIHSKRQHASTDEILEYRLEVAPAQLVRLTEAGVKGVRPPIENGNSVEGTDDEADGEDEDEDGSKKGRTRVKKPPPEPSSHLRLWMPACMVRIVEPQLVDEFESAEKKKRLKKESAAEKKTKKGSMKLDVRESEMEEDEGENPSDVFKLNKISKSKASQASTKNVLKPRYALSEKDKETEGDGEDFSDVFGLKKSSCLKAAQPRARKTLQSRPALAQEEEETEEEYAPSSTFKSSASRSTLDSIVTGGKLKSTGPIATTKTSSSKPLLKKSITSSAVLRPTLRQILEQGDSTDCERAVRHASSITIISSDDSPVHNSPVHTPKKSNVVQTFGRHLTQSLHESSNPPRPQRQPFPMDFSEDEEDLASGDDSKYHNAQMQDIQAVKSRSKLKQSGSESSCKTNPLLKSPRKSKDHTSPRMKRLHCGDAYGGDPQNENIRPRSVSPTCRQNMSIPTEMQVPKIVAKSNAVMTRDTTVIVLSSDDDIPISKQVAVRPLLLAKARLKAKPAKLKSSSVMRTLLPGAVIDLT